MSYDPNRISIKPCGEVVRGGLPVGTIQFAGMLGEMRGIGEHWAEDYGAEDVERLQARADDLDDEVTGLTRDLDQLQDAAERLLSREEIKALAERPELRPFIEAVEALL